MEIFCRGVPEHTTEKHLKRAFAAPLKELLVYTYHSHKLSGRNATVTICDVKKALMLLDRFGPSPARHGRPKEQLKLFGSSIHLSKSRFPPDELLLRSLDEEENKRLEAEKRRGSQRVAPQKQLFEATTVQPQKKFHITSLSCGSWDYEASNPIFVGNFYDVRKGTVTFGRSFLKVLLESNSTGVPDHQIQFDYSNVVGSIYLSHHGAPTMTFTIEVAPRIFESESSLIIAMQSMALNVRNLPKKKRVSSLGTGHDNVLAMCFTYRLTLRDRTSLQSLHALNALKKENHIPKLVTWSTDKIVPRVSHQTELDLFTKSVYQQQVPYRIKFQLQMLVWNGSLSPSKVSEMLPRVHQLLQSEGLDRAVQILQIFARKIQYAGPEVDASEFRQNTLAEYLLETDTEWALGKQYQALPAHPNRASIHKATITPVGIYLYGPTWESKNRVLRRYSNHIDYFMRVEFSEETGDAIRFDPNASLDHVFNRRFKTVLQFGFVVGDRHFEFLGFSHSSLRSQSCWFMAPFTMEDGNLINARKIISSLGDFSGITSAAKCAARIGQSFSDTLTAIKVDQSIVQEMLDVQRNGRTFSDGVGTISESVMHKIWRGYALRATLKPTVFQIRFAGAKGMVSLDERLKGDVLRLRESMIKFPCENSWDIEICGSGINPLPMYLNRQLIKILEDLGVPLQPFLDLQSDDIDRLRITSQSPIRIANFLERANLSRSVKMPWLIKCLGFLKFPFRNDKFLRQTIELVAILRLRELKYRARITVEDGFTLYGVMDETGFLQEGEIYCPIDSETSGRIVRIQRNVVVTRSPALHPGDVQIVTAVDVPEDSPLKRLHNCVVFSQHGERDLPSKLSGGDLDGDIYNIIFDERLCPAKIGKPADYPRVSAPALGRPVVTDDIIDHFLTFMATDQLGRVANLHLTVADQKPLGTFDEVCLKLAELHSTAVDFSKTGIPVDISTIPRASPFRPDFMAPGPRVKIEDDLTVLLNTTPPDLNDEDEEEGREVRYYKSNKVLGELYRAIDEQEFVKELNDSAEDLTPNAKTVLEMVWEYAQFETAAFEWKHHLGTAKDIKELYEENLTDLMWQYSSRPWVGPVTEVEVFVGSLMGTDKNQSRRQKEASLEMRNAYDALAEFVISQILNKEAGGEEALERSIACLARGIIDEKNERANGREMPGRFEKPASKLVSFRWIAASACLQEVDKLQRALREGKYD